MLNGLFLIYTFPCCYQRLLSCNVLLLLEGGSNVPLSRLPAFIKQHKEKLLRLRTSNKEELSSSTQRPG